MMSGTGGGGGGHMLAHGQQQQQQQSLQTGGSAPSTSASVSGSGSARAPPPLTHPGEEAQMESLVLAYLKRRGYTNAEEALRAEASRAQRSTATTSAAGSGSGGVGSDVAAASSVPASAPPPGTVDVHALSADLSLDQHTHLVRQLLLYSSSECSPDAYSSSFEHLKRWIADCMQVYRNELHALLWPIYAHVFIQLVHRGFPQDAHRFLSRFRADHESLHKSELHTFQNLISDSDLHKCEIIRWFLQRKVEVAMSAYSHQLLIAFLEENRYLLLLKIINEHMHIRVTSRKPLQLEGDSLPSSSALLASAGSVSPLNPLAVANLNNTPIRWGMLPELAELHAEAASKLKAKLRDSQLAAKMARLKEEKEKAEAAEAARKAKEAADSKEAAAANDDEEEGEGAPKKKAKTEEGTDGAAAASGDADMADADETTAAAAAGDAAPGGGGGGAATGASDKSKKSKKKDPNLAAADARDPLKETKEERDAIERTVKQQIKMPEAMPVPKKEDATAVVQLPPIPVDARARYLADLHFRHKLSPSSLPSICLYTFLNSLHSVNGVNISPDGALVSCAMSDSTVRVYDLRDPLVRLSTNPHANPTAGAEGKDDETRALENSIYADGQEATAGSFSTITSSLLPHRRFPEESTKLPYSKLVGHGGPVYATALSPEGQYLLSGSEDATVRLWHLETKKNLVVYKGHNYPIWDVAFGPLGHYFATASHDHTARLWSTNHISPLRLFVGHSSDVDVVRFHPNSNYVATGSADSTARLWDIQTGECVRVLVGHTGGVRSLAMDPEGRYAATGGDDGRVLVWDLGTGRQVTAYNAHSAPVTALDYSADAEVLASGSLDCTLRLLEPSHAHRTTPLHTYHTKRTPVHFLKFTPRNVLLAAGIFHA